MKIIPSSIPLETKSSAERKLFEAFSRIDFKEPGICYHSLRLSQHQYKREGELDFVILTRTGLFVLEVKGGQVSRDDSGIWKFTDRYGIVHKRSSSPFEQAGSGSYSLVKSIKDHFEQSGLPNFTFGYGVVFPDCKFSVVSPEWSADMVLDSSKCRDDVTLTNSLKRLMSYWAHKSGHSSPLDSEWITKIAQYIRPRFDLSPNLAYRADELDREMTTLTSEQYILFDAIERNKRIICSGGAGTGKTFLGLEVARRHSDRDNAVLFVCKSPVLATYLRTRVNVQITVTSLESLPAGSKYDVLIVDEAQDLLNMENLSELDKYLKGGLENGVWRIFLDINNQKGIYGKYEPDALQMLESFNPAFLELHRNCRNTLNIVSQTRLLTAADLGKPAAGDGPQVAYRYDVTGTGTVRKLEDELSMLLANDVPLGEITILSPVPLKESITAMLPQKYLKKIVELSISNVSRFPDGQLTYSTIGDFKGLENKFIILVDLDSTHFQDDNLSTVYVGMTRARAGLTIILGEHLKKVVNTLSLKSLEKFHPVKKKV